MLRKLALVAFVPAALAFSIACGGGGGDDTPPVRPTNVPAEVPFIDQDNLKFKPTSLAAAVGEEIWFANSESALHTVTINGTNESGTMKRGTTFTWTPSAAGEYKITCDFHPQMKATITVTDPK